MRFLKLQTAGGRREVTSRFGGYWPEDGAAENQFYDMRNLCADAAPFLMPRGKRTKVFEGETPQGIHGGEKLLYADAGVLYYNHAAVGEVTPGRKQVVQMGARVLILPDKQVFDTGTQTLSACHKAVIHSFNNGLLVSFLRRKIFLKQFFDCCRSLLQFLSE